MKNKLEIETINQITLLLQITLSIYVVSFAIMSIFEKELFVISEILIGLLMFVIAYNNHKLYKRKYMTAVYIGFGIIIIASTLFA